MNTHALLLATCAGLLVAAGAAHAQDGRNRATSAAPCCPITAIDNATGMVTATDPAGESFRFSVRDGELLRSLKVGQAVYADFATGRVRIHGADPCCAIARGTERQVKPAEPVGTPTADGAAPCCAITAIAPTGIVTARAATSGRVFRFRVADRALLTSLRTGQQVWADFRTGKVRINGVAPCCAIIP